MFTFNNWSEFFNIDGVACVLLSPCNSMAYVSPFVSYRPFECWWPLHVDGRLHVCTLMAACMSVDCILLPHARLLAFFIEAGKVSVNINFGDHLKVHEDSRILPFQC
jgi:hypothetical protein